MIYPKFLKENSTIGICAPSMGVGDKLEDYEQSINVLKKENYNIIETDSVRNVGNASNDQIIRATEFNEIISNQQVDLILIARGGELLYETLPYLNFSNILNNQKWIMGYSDPTSILFSITTKYDIATIYGFNSVSYDQKHECVQNNLNIIKGNKIVQKSFSKFYDSDGNSHKIKWLSNKKVIELQGRLIGGCLEVLKDLIGTEFYDINKFNKKYQQDGIIWYFDIFDSSAVEFYRTLLQMKNNNWFSFVKCIFVSRIKNKDEEYMTYQEAIEKVFPDTPYIIDMCFGHTFPRMTFINGSICKIKYKRNKGNIEFELR